MTCALDDLGATMRFRLAVRRSFVSAVTIHYCSPSNFRSEVRPGRGLGSSRAALSTTALTDAAFWALCRELPHSRGWPHQTNLGLKK